MEQARPRSLRTGWLVNALPDDYRGPRHYVAVKCTPTGHPGIEWCEYEERVGRAPKAEKTT